MLIYRLSSQPHSFPSSNNNKQKTQSITIEKRRSKVQREKARIKAMLKAESQSPHINYLPTHTKPCLI